ncbi:hypothetical protein [Marinobacter salsuginis]|uniref:hypothetical protein n=1 Tax=Marinobacter salsuginis TaxID=418719 RepID=UPI001ADEEAE9|nr:hypothetical protein [Marinobacter salsuginis]QTN43431.1 hypothetical protein HZ997_08895 [Marinobacter salsuginis]
MTALKTYFVLALITLLVTGCATPLNVEQLQEFRPENRVVVLVNSTRYDTKLRVALAKKGFKVLKFASNQSVITEGNADEIARSYNEAAARYGITFYHFQVDRCLGNSSKLIDGVIELSDLKTNEVIMVIENGGWTGPCTFDTRDDVFDGLAKALSENWS